MYAHTKPYEVGRGGILFSGFMYPLETHPPHLGETVLKHFAVNDVRFHPQRYSMDTRYFSFSKII